MISLGTRWPLGGEPPARLPADFVAVLLEAESRLAADGMASGSWTLTWLEGRPIAELDTEAPDGYPTVSVDPATGEPRLTFDR
ncbi:MAG: hypothetical protein JWP66_64 [Naasia sp.]|nr:hypothetical protein [Naasia sp.]